MKTKTTLSILFFAMATINSFAQAPPNDNCIGAITLTPNATCVPTSGTDLNATASSTPVCTGAAEDDVWYTFTATNVLLNITVTPGGIFDPVIQVFSTSPCAGIGGGVSISCTNATGAGIAESVCLTGLTVGSSYWIRVYDFQPFPTPVPTFTICVTNCSSIGVSELLTENADWIISPNPASGVFQISNFKFQIANVKVVTILGEIILQSTINNQQSTINIDVSSLAKGIYFVEIKDVYNKVWNRKVVVQ